MNRPDEQSPSHLGDRDQCRLPAKMLWWACQDLNLGPHPYQGSAPGPVSAGSRLPPARTTYRWRPLETVANRSAPMACGPNVDQARPLAGAAALRVADLGWQGDPRRLPPTSEPRPGDRLVRGSPGGVWARDIPLYRRAVPGHRHGGTQAAFLLKPAARSSVGAGCSASGEVGFEPAVGFLQQSRSATGGCGDVQVWHTCRDRSCPPSTQGCRCTADPPRTMGFWCRLDCRRPSARFSVTGRWAQPPGSARPDLAYPSRQPRRRRSGRSSLPPRRSAPAATTLPP